MASAPGSPLSWPLVCAGQGTGAQETLVHGRERPRDPVALLTCGFARHSHETASTRTERLIRAPRAGLQNMKLSIALLAAPALAFAPVAQQRASVKVEYRVENHAM